jgi:hypothetical protein
MKLRFEIGDVAYAAMIVPKPENVVCPDCGGTRRIKVTLFDWTMHELECEFCRRGYEGAVGYIETKTCIPKAKSVILNGVSVNGEHADWYTNEGVFADYDMFETLEAAFARALDKEKEFEEEEKRRMTRKYNSKRSWAWHVGYYRREIREAEARIKYAKERLGYAIEQKKVES